MNLLATMDDWIAPVFIVIVLVMIIGNFSTVQKSAKTPLRKKGLNDLEETLPRSHQKAHKMPTMQQGQSSVIQKEKGQAKDKE